MDGNAKNRYVEIAKICVMADKIRQLGIGRVADVQKSDLGGFLINDPDGIVPAHALGDDLPEGAHNHRDDSAAPGYNAPVMHQIPIARNAMGDYTDTMRSVADIVKDAMAPREKKRPLDEQLDGMLHMRAMLVARGDANPEQISVIDRRIDHLMTELDKDTADARNNSTVVHPKLLRGSEARSEGREDLQPRDDRSHADGANGAGEVRDPGQEEEVDREQLGSWNERLECAPGADRDRSEGAGEDLEAHPNDRLGGEIPRRDDGGDPIFAELDRATNSLRTGIARIARLRQDLEE